ncbi:MAG: ABC transporter permease [Desulfuromonadales bacterium]|nr:ABC transporter permease [Desulfuromonadales bacterium]NIR33045.1 ABC transporter permease [Desulfuromonadales bacterium]NIS43064.1 ABC transporter permease [Desulfuromonadales bacterium]
MNLFTIAWNNLRRRKARLVFLLLGLLVGVATVVTLVTLSESLIMDAQHKMENYGANIVITPRSDQLALSYGGITLGGVAVGAEEIREKDLEGIATIPNVKNIAAVAPKVLGAVEVEDQRVMLMGVKPEEEFRLKRWWQVTGRPLEKGDEVVLGSAAASTLGLGMGDRFEIGERSFTVTGILEETGSQDDALLIADLRTAQHLLDKQGQVTLVEVAALCADCPVEDMVSQLSAALPGAKVSALQQVVKTRMHALEQFRIFSLGIAGVVLCIGALMVFVTMMGAVNERTREIGIFRALGFRRGHVVALVQIEAAAVSLLAGLLGFVGGLGASWIILPFLAEEHAALIFNPLLGAGAVFLAITVGCLASIYPALHASRLDPTEALRAL